MPKIKLLRITTVPVSLQILLRGQHRYMSGNFRVVGISSPGIHLVQVAKEEGIETIPVEMARDISLVKDVSALWQLYRVIKKEKPSIVHTHTPKAGAIGMLAAWLCRIPVRLHTVAGLPLLENTGIKRSILNVVERITYSCATKVYPNSFGLKNIILQNNFCSVAKLHVIGNGSSNGIDTNYFSVQQIPSETIQKLKSQYEIKATDFIFIFIGRLVKDKGINELVQAFKNINQKHSQTKLLLVGNAEPELDPLNPETEYQIKEHQAIITTGFQTDVRPFLALAYALVFPSYREGFPNVPMQAGAMGLPSIVTDINGCNEIIQHEENGLIIPTKNTIAIEQAMLRLIEDKHLAKKLASNARESIVSRFDQQTLWKLIKEEYDEQLRLAGIEK